MTKEISVLFNWFLQLLQIFIFLIKIYIYESTITHDVSSSFFHTLIKIQIFIVWFVNLKSLNCYFQLK